MIQRVSGLSTGYSQVFGVNKIDSSLLFGRTVDSIKGRTVDSITEVVNYCAYKGETFTESRKSSFDHIRPKSAGGGVKIENGIAACAPCNSRRSNVPVLEFLEGDNHYYKYSKKGEQVVKTSGHVGSRPSPWEVKQRQVFFSKYLKDVVENSSNLPLPDKDNWLAHSLDNLLFPVWKEGIKPNNQSCFEERYHRRTKAFLKILSDADPDYWLGDKFKQNVIQQFQRHSLQKSAMLNAIDDLRQRRNTAQLDQPPAATTDKPIPIDKPTSSKNDLVSDEISRWVAHQISKGRNPFEQPHLLKQLITWQKQGKWKGNK